MKSQKTAAKRPKKVRTPGPKKKEPLVRGAMWTCGLGVLRKDRGLSLRAVSTQTNIPPATILRAEQGYGITLRAALRLSRFYGTPVEKLWAEK